MRADLLQLAAELARKETPFVLAIVTSRRPASSAQPGDMALVTADGEFHGWLGGACTRPTVVREAQAALADGKPRLLALAPDAEAAQRPGVLTFPMTCHSGGSVEIYLEPVLPAARLVLFGGSPAARALARLGHAMGYGITIVDADLASASGGPSSPMDETPPSLRGAQRRSNLDVAIATGASRPRDDKNFLGGAHGTAELPPRADLRASLDGGELGPSSAARPLYVVVATMGEGDEEAITAALRLAPAYLGVVASQRRFEAMRQTLRARGVSDEVLRAVKSPAGLSIGARTPEEIALAVLAEIVQLRRAAAADAPAAAAPEPAPAIDPICGMTVTVAGAKHRAEHAGQTFYFCCAGCRERFLAEPARYLSTEARA